MIVLILFVICLSAFLIANALYKRTNDYKRSFTDVAKFVSWSHAPKSLKIVNIGSNHPKYAFDWSVTSFMGENCAVGPEAFEYDYAILRHIAPSLSDGAVVVIPICLLNFYLYRFESRSNYYKYYTFLNSEDIHNYSRAEILFHLKLPLLSNPLFALRIFRDVSVEQSLNLTTNRLNSEEELKADADKWYEGWEKQFGIKLLNPTLSKKNFEDVCQNIRILRQILEFCKSKGYKPVISILPVTKYLSTKFTDKFIQEHILNYIDEANVVKAPVLNYFLDERFSSPEFYINSFFMNKKGRTVFTKEFVSELMRRKLL